jgi:hypothetical protein
MSFIDQFTKYAELIPVPDQTAATRAKVFVTRIIAKYVTPKFVVSDRGSQLLSELFTETCKLQTLAEYVLLATILRAIWWKGCIRPFVTPYRFMLIVQV